MEQRAVYVSARINKDLKLELIPGHFATRHSHINFYINLTDLKNRHGQAQKTALELARQIGPALPIDTIACLDDTEVIGAFLADALDQPQQRSINAGADIAIVTPESNPSGQYIFRDNVQHLIGQKNVLLLVASATTGQTMQQAIDCVQYYQGRVVGVAALFSAIESINGLPIHKVFSLADISGYQTSSPPDCAACKAGQKIDALVNSYGYSKL